MKIKGYVANIFPPNSVTAIGGKVTRKIPAQNIGKNLHSNEFITPNKVVNKETQIAEEIKPQPGEIGYNFSAKA